MHELIRWHDGTLYVNAWLILGLILGLAFGQLAMAALGAVFIGRK